jgi:protein involved in polysaccharide export with SLBB domain
VPPTPFGVGRQLGETARFEGRNVFFVLGSVATPGVRNLEDQIDVLDAIALAGGLTPEADLSNVRVIMKGPRYSKIVKMDLQKYVDEGSPPRFILHPEDTVFVPSAEEGLFSTIMGRVGDFIPIITAVGTIVLLVR